MNRKGSVKTLACLLALSVMLLGCRGSDEPAPEDEVKFPATPDTDAFISFLNPAPAIPFGGVGTGIDNVMDFPEAYYNTIDPQRTRSTFSDWRIQNGFLNADGTAATCEAPGCISTHVKFRDTKDLGYGRNMFMRWDTISGDIALYVENFQVDVPGLPPYGPLNFDALVANDRSWNFGVNAIEFSAYPNTGGNQRPFAKFYNFAGDGKRALLASGLQQHFVDLDGRGNKPMPTPCIVCHGGRGRTLVIEDANGTKRLAPTITGGVPGDVQAQLQVIEVDTLGFSEEPGFTREENEDGLRLINAAVLASYETRTLPSNRQGDWQPTFAINLLEGRYNGDPDNPANSYDADYVPGNWAVSNQNLFKELIGPNCMVCHALRGSGLNSSIQMAQFTDFQAYGDRIDQLVFEHSLMPLGLLNYSNFWDEKEPAELANAINHPERIDDNNRAIRPGRAVASITAPLKAAGFSSLSGAMFDITISGLGSAFVPDDGYEWSVSGGPGVSIAASDIPGEAILRSSTAGPVDVTLQVSGGDVAGIDTDTVTIDIEDASADSPDLSALTFYGPSGIQQRLVSLGCVGCHNPVGGYDGIPVYFEPCQGSANNDGREFLYRSVLARINFQSPSDSLLLRKPTNGAMDLENRSDTDISGYHAGGNLFVDHAGVDQATRDQNDRQLSAIVGWILNGAPQGSITSATIDPGAASCE